MENWLEYVKTKYVVTDIADDSIVYETVVEGDIRNVIMPSDIIRSRKDYRLSIYLETDDDRINSKLANKLLASLIWNSSALKLSSDDGINLGDLITADTFQTVINNIYNQLKDIDLTQFYNKQEAHEHFVEDVVHVGGTPPDDDNMLWYDTSAGGYQLSDDMLMTMKGTVATKNNLPSTGMVNGDVWKVTDENAFYVFNKNQWEVFSGDKTVIVAQNEEPVSRNVLWYDLDDDGSDVANLPTGSLADNFRFSWIRDPNEPSYNQNITKLINYSNATIEYKAIKEEITRAFKDISIRAPLNVSVNFFPQYEQLRNINTDSKDFGIIPLVKSVEFLQEPDFTSSNVIYKTTELPLIGNISNSTGAQQVIPIKVTLFDGSSKEFKLILCLYRNPLESVTTNYVERIEVPISQVWSGNVPDGTEFTGTLFYFGPELVIGYHPHGGEATYRHKFTLPVMSVESVDEYIGLVGSNKFHDLEPEAMNKVIQDMKLSFTPKTTIKNGKLVLFIPGGMTGTRKIAMDQPISGSDIYVTLKKGSVSKEFVLKRYEDYKTQDFTNVSRYGFDIVKMDLLTLITKDYERKDLTKVTTLANPLNKYIGCFLQGNGVSSVGTNTNSSFLYFSNFTSSVFHNIREITPNTTDIKNLSLSSDNVMWYNKVIDQVIYPPLLKNSKKQSQCGLNVKEDIDLITLPSDGNKKLFVQITQPQHNINTGTKLYRIDIPLSAFTALGLPVPGHIIDRMSKLINASSQAPVEDSKPELSSLFKIWETKYDFDSGVETTSEVNKIQHFTNYKDKKPNDIRRDLENFFILGSGPEVLPYTVEEDSPGSFWASSNPDYIDTNLFTRTVDIGQMINNYWVKYKSSRITDRPFLTYRPYEEVNSLIKSIEFTDDSLYITEEDLKHSYNYILNRTIPAKLIFDDNSTKLIDIELTYAIAPDSTDYITANHYVNRMELSANNLSLNNGDSYVGTISWTGPKIILSKPFEKDEVSYVNHVTIPVITPEKYDEIMTNDPTTNMLELGYDGYKNFVSRVSEGKLNIYIPAMSVPDSYTAYSHRQDWGMDDWTTPRHLSPMLVELTKVVNGIPDNSTKTRFLIRRDKMQYRQDSLYYTEMEIVKVDLSQVLYKTEDEYRAAGLGANRTIYVYLQYNNTTDAVRTYNDLTKLNCIRAPFTTILNSASKNGRAGFLIPKIKETIKPSDEAPAITTERWMTEIHHPESNYPEYWLENARFDKARIDPFTNLITDVKLIYDKTQPAGMLDTSFIWPVFYNYDQQWLNNIRVSVLGSSNFTTSIWPSTSIPPLDVNGWVYNQKYAYMRTPPVFLQIPTYIFEKYGLPTPGRTLYG